MRRFGFSTGAIAKGNFRRALSLLRETEIEVVELSALRMDELEPLISAIPELDLDRYSFVSLHAPSQFTAESEAAVIESLACVARFGFPVVVHPDVVFTPKLWRPLGDTLLIENMDKRKPTGRNVRELRKIFDSLPTARFCFDIGHARQVDPSMTEAAMLLDEFGDRLAEVHMSEVTTASRHDPISFNAVMAFRTVARNIPETTPIILESLIDDGQSDMHTEIERAHEALLSTTVDEMLRRAIANRRLVRISYHSKDRIVEPHDYGIQKGIVRLLAYQVGGESSGSLPNWRWFDVRDIASVELLETQFAGGRGASSGKHHKWDQLFLRVTPAA